MSNVKDEGIKNPERFLANENLDLSFVKEAIDFVIKKIDENLDTFTHKFPSATSVNNVYRAVDNATTELSSDWTSGFWTGMLWLAYEVTGDEKYRKVAEIQLDSFEERIDKEIIVDHHDMGFLYSLSCVSAYRLTGNERAKEIALKAANKLITRYVEKAGIIQAWGDMSNPEQLGRMIIDCNMNLGILYWAYEVTGDKKYYDIAASHVKQAAKYIVREDASTFHTYYMDVETGKPKHGKTAQGFADDSCWARGQAWGIYGFPLSYMHTGDWELIELAKKVTNYFLNRLPEDYICYWDLIFSEGSGHSRDSSAAAIACCGLLEMLKYLPLCDEYRKPYEVATIKMLKSLHENYSTKNTPESNGVLLHAVYAYPTGLGVDECNIWGDYFYFEALVRAVKNWKLYW